MPEKREVSYVGINYSGSLAPLTNMDEKTGIRYGIIPFRYISDTWSEIGNPFYGDSYCPYCGSPTMSETKVHDHLKCEECGEVFAADDMYTETPISHDYHDDDYTITEHNDGDIFVIKSPFYTYAQHCSPCAPGACHLMHPLTKEAITNGNNRCYALPHTWFDDHLAPYDVYRVVDNSFVSPEDV